MSDFYSEMADMAQELLATTAQGGLGQEGVVLRRTIPATPNPAEPWVRPEETIQEEPLKAAASGSYGFATGSQEVSRSMILATDTRIIAAVPSVIDWRTAEPSQLSILVGGRWLAIIHTETIPHTGTPVAVAFFAREG